MSDAATTTPERAKKPGFVYWLGRCALTPLVRGYYRPTVTGRANVPKSGRVIFASNHLSFVDSIAIPICAPRPVQFLAKSSYFTGRGLTGWVVRMFFTAIGAVGIDRGAGHAAQAALDTGRAILESDSAFAIYPEGTRSLDGRLYKGRTGVSWLALTTGAVVVPVALTGTDEMMPVGARLPQRASVTVTFGTPINLSGYGSATSGRARRQATDEIMAAIHTLSGQELAGTYNENPPSTPAEKIRQAVLRPERF